MGAGAASAKGRRARRTESFMMVRVERGKSSKRKWQIADDVGLSVAVLVACRSRGEVLYFLYRRCGCSEMEAKCKRQIHLPIRISRQRQCGLAYADVLTVPGFSSSKRLNVVVLFQCPDGEVVLRLSALLLT
jgi:hypothetical protein